jgi:hypothetical protein
LDEGVDARNSRSPRVGEQEVEELTSDPEALVRVGYLEGDLAGAAIVHIAGDACHCRRQRVAVHVSDEDVVVPIDAREDVELGAREARLGRVEAALARRGTEPLEKRGDSGGVAVAEQADGDDLAERAIVKSACLHGRHSRRATPSRLRLSRPSCDGPIGPLGEAGAHGRRRRRRT